jgi:hypothetical protein
VAKVRVYELAKDLGLESKELLAKLQEVGEFVSSASSTVEAPVVRKLMDKFPDLKAVEAAPKPAKKAAAKKTAAKKSAAPTAEEIEAALAALPESTREQLTKAQIEKPVAPEVPAAPVTPVTPAAPATSAVPSMPRPPRAGNNPFGSGAGSGNNAMPRPPAQRPLRPGERPPMSGPRQDQFVQVLLHVHNKHVQQLAHQHLVHVQAHLQLVHQIQILLIAHRMQMPAAHQQPLVVQVAQAVKAADVINVAELRVHLESKAENLVRHIRVRKRCVKSSTIWRHHHLVAQ